MKSLSGIMTAVLFVSVQSMAQTAAPVRACRFSGGQFFIAETDLGSVGVCKFSNTFVGSLDILNKNARIEIPLSLHNYRKGVRRCIEQNLANLYLNETDTVEICHYSDGSFIDLDTLTTGKEHMRNTKLNRALGIF